MKVLLSSEQHEQAVSWLCLWKWMKFWAISIVIHNIHKPMNKARQMQQINVLQKQFQQWPEMHALILTQCSVIVAIISAYPILMNELLNINELNDYDMLLALLILLVWAKSTMKMALGTEKEQTICFCFCFNGIKPSSVAVLLVLLLLY